MKFSAIVEIMPHKELLDPQGKAVLNGLQKMNYSQIHNVRIGKRIELSIDAENEAVAMQIAKESCEKLLVNKIMEQYSVKLTAVEG
jgi:phosphoribosylformylglycinamidine synthase PurS subunit